MNKQIYKKQMLLYIFIIAFGLQNTILEEFNFGFGGYEIIIQLVFYLSVITALGSVVLLIYQIIKSVNKKNFITTEIIYLIINIILYYGVVYISLYLSTRVRF